MVRSGWTKDWPGGFESVAKRPRSRLETHRADETVEPCDEVLPGVRIQPRWDYEVKPQVTGRIATGTGLPREGLAWPDPARSRTRDIRQAPSEGLVIPDRDPHPKGWMLERAAWPLEWPR